jgi:hypothetical protein
LRQAMAEVRAGWVSLLYNPRRNLLPDPRMNVTDYLVIAAFLISAVVGAMRGFLREAVALVTWLVALFIAWHFADLIEPHLGGLLSGSYVKPWAARIIIVLLIRREVVDPVPAGPLRRIRGERIARVGWRAAGEAHGRRDREELNQPEGARACAGL